MTERTDEFIRAMERQTGIVNVERVNSREDEIVAVGIRKNGELRLPEGFPHYITGWEFHSANWGADEPYVWFRDAEGGLAP